jgi:hypothetical protein
LGPKEEEVTEDWRKLYIEELNDLYRSLNNFWLIKSRNMNRAGHLACNGVLGGWTNECILLVGKPEGNNFWKTRA